MSPANDPRGAAARWQRLEALYRDTVTRPEGERDAALLAACPDDADLRAEVQALLNEPESAARFLSSPALYVAAGLASKAGASLAGKRIGVFEIRDLIGVGGMGQVYRAHDTRLKRDVAIKLLPRDSKDDPDRMARFEREAHLLASLNHPNIGSVYGLEDAEGLKALVMELVEGEDLSDRIWRGALPIAEALPIARQIAEAIEAAHERGVIHRDLKPGNIKLRADGTVKVLDFGLAKAMAPAGDVADDPTKSPTLTARATKIGMILGTAAYMAPEQALGKTVDRRADIWSFGVVLYEMLTGKRAFKGDDVPSTLAAVLSETPSFSALPPSAPPRIRRLLERCLDRDPKTRLRDIGEARVELARAEAGVPDGALTTSPLSAAPLRRPLPGAVVAAAILAVAAAGFLAARLWGPSKGTEPRQFVLLPPEGGSFGSGPDDRTPAFRLSPDGTRVAFVATVAANRRIWIRSINSLEAVPLGGTEGAAGFTPPCWSPDGSAIAFVADGKLKKVSVQGGTPVTLADAPNGQGISWNQDGTIVFAPSPNDALLRVADGGGTPVPVTRLRPGDLGHVFPQFLPDGRHFVYFIRAPAPRKGIYVGSISSLEEKHVRPTRERALYAGPGYLLFLEDGRLFAQSFDAGRLALSGDAVPVTDSVAYINTDGRASFDVSPNGTLAFRVSGIRTASQPVWVGRDGKPIENAGPPGDYSSASLSPDGTRLAIELHDLNTATGDIWIHDLARKSTGVFTTDRMHNTRAVWSPDGREIVFAGRPDGGRNLHLKKVDDASGDELLLPLGIDRLPADWSRDGRHILYEEGPSDNNRDLWTLQMPERIAKPFLVTKASERSASFSPDGRWVAYKSNETGRDEIYVVSFPNATAKVPVSTNGGAGARWHPNGRELFFVDARNVVHAVAVTTGATFSAGAPRPLFTAERFGEAWFDTDGERFFIVPDPPGATPTAPPITVVEDWASLLTARR